MESLLSIIAMSLPTLAIKGENERFAVRQVYCVGRNYADHVREMGKSPAVDAPFFFCKSVDSVCDAHVGVPYPSMTHNLQHEVELVVLIGQRGACIAAEDAHQHIFGYAIGLDMTRRDLQLAARDSGKPWEFGKSFPNSAPIGPVHPVAQTGHLSEGEIWLRVNGQPRQRADLSDMLWGVSEQIAYLSRYYELHPGDVLMTGTPAGVGPVEAGDVIEAGISGLSEITVLIHPS
jgi:fumarylpyruvate hydrolase